MKRQLYTKEEVVGFIKEGKVLVLSADEKMLNDLPKGNWIGGTSSYFMDTEGAVLCTDKIFVDDFTDIATGFKIETYTENSINNIALNTFVNGFIVIVIPTDTEVHSEFALNSLTYKNVFNNPLVGYVAGYDLQRTNEKLSSYVYNGLNQDKITDQAIALHIELPKNKIARAEILNIDTIDKSSPKIQFPRTGFLQSECLIDGKLSNIAEYFNKINYDGLPIIANNNGALINKDIKNISADAKEVSFYSPIFNDETYFLVNNVDDYQKVFEKRLQIEELDVPYSCLCVSFYLRGNLNGKKINTEAVFTFGEIAFQLLNKTVVYLEIDDV